MQILLVPLDERPVNTRYPQMTAAIAGASVILPPSAILSQRKRPADREALVHWLRDNAPACEASIICIESLAYGGLIASRTSHEPAWDIISHLSILNDLPRPLFIANVITRVNRDNNSTEEPDYWREYGNQLYAYSNAHSDKESAEKIAATIPVPIRQDFLWRRARNHVVNQAVLTEATHFDLLVIASDDTNPFGLPSRERTALAALRDQLGLTAKVLMYPGADELGCTLTARLLNRGHSPHVYIDYIVPGGENITAKYEDRAVSYTVEGQLAAIGGTLANSPAEADLMLFVNPPSEAGQEWELVDPQHERATRAKHIADGIQRLNYALDCKQRVAIADVAYPNGADPILIEQLFNKVPISDLASYGAWNTAGNTIGSVLAAATIPVKDEDARRLYLAHRFLEDWGYQHIVRRAVRTRHGLAEVDRAETIDHVWQEIEEGLQAPLDKLAKHGLHFQLTEVILPWQRTFEVDFTLM